VVVDSTQECQGGFKTLHQEGVVKIIFDPFLGNWFWYVTELDKPDITGHDDSAEAALKFLKYYLTSQHK